ncbi:hypothetical protein [Thioalkalivibrio sp. ALMg11]|uniref:hypothetical protein n=1 Tax=Thioalkalivibrio sp. ALMg11 TaxID=1158165 RepID=UPI0004780C98
MRAPIVHEAHPQGRRCAAILAALLVLAPLPAAAASADSYTVQSGDNLSVVANRLRPDPSSSLPRTMEALYAHNPHAFSGGPENLKVGAVLQIPDTVGQQATAVSTPTQSRAVATASTDDGARRAFVFGEEQEEDADPQDEAFAPAWDIRVDDAAIELGALGTSDRPVDYVQYGRGVVSARRDLNEAWDLRLGARLDVRLQQGGDRPDLARVRGDYDETYLRYNGDRLRFTAGAQKILWGRVDEIPPTDRLATRDLTRFALDDLADRRRASPALRLEWFQGPWHADMVFLPLFRAAELPHRDSLWHPVDRTRGRLLGVPDQPGLAPLIRAAEVDDDVSGTGGGGVRLARTGRGIDFALTAQRARHSEPYYRLDDATRQAVLAGTTPESTPVLEAVHPRTWVLGGDAALATGAWTWRAEAAWLSDVPVTRSNDLAMDTARGLDWVVGLEGFPGDGDFRMTTQLAGQHLLNAGDILDNRDAYFLTGELESPFRDHAWRARLRYSVGLDQRDIYLNPELAWIAREPMEFYIGLHWLDGREGTAGGFYRDNRMLVTGWRGQF